MKVKMQGSIIEQMEIGQDIFSMWIEAPSIAAEAAPGQFVVLYSKDKSRLLPRPISLCEIDKNSGSIRLVYRIAGAGTREFSLLKKGDSVELMGPLGNGFPLDQVEGKRILLMGGGIGVPPMLETARQATGVVQVVAGYRDELFLDKELAGCSSYFVATETGSVGTKGNVLDAVRENDLQADAIFACGPKPMLRAIKEYAAKADISCWISLEEKMACGIGACLACTCQSTEQDSHSMVNNKRICKDGPVFLSSEVELS